MNNLVCVLFFFLIIFHASRINCKFLNNLYHHTNEIFEELDHLASNECSQTLKSKEFLIREESQVNKLKYYIIQKREEENRSNFLKSQKKIPKYFMIFGEHSRELITTEQAFYLIKSLCQNNSEYSSEITDRILSKAEIYVIPIMNVYGRKKVEEGDWCWRTNENKVDLNRNWDINWELFNTISSGGENSGNRPFSEWETRYLNTLLKDISPDVFITTHSGSLGMYTPFAYKMVDLDEPKLSDLNKMIDILGIINEENCFCQFGAMGNIFPYMSSGTCLDYAYEKLNIKYDFAFEIYNGNHRDDEYTEKILKNKNLEPLSIKNLNMKETPTNNNENDDIQNLAVIDVLNDKNPQLQLNSFNKNDFKEINRALNEIPFSIKEKRSKIKMNQACMTQMNPLDELSFKNTLINWTNIYFKLFLLISNELNK